VSLLKVCFIACTTFSYIATSSTGLARTIYLYTVYIRFFWQENHQIPGTSQKVGLAILKAQYGIPQIYGHIRCINTDLANPIPQLSRWQDVKKQTISCLSHTMHLESSLSNYWARQPSRSNQLSYNVQRTLDPAYQNNECSNSLVWLALETCTIPFLRMVAYSLSSVFLLTCKTVVIPESHLHPHYLMYCVPL